MKVWRQLVNSINLKKETGSNYNEEIISLEAIVDECTDFEALQIYSVLLYERENIFYAMKITEKIGDSLNFSILRESDRFFLISILNKALIFIYEKNIESNTKLSVKEKIKRLDKILIEHEENIKINPRELIYFLMEKTRKNENPLFSAYALKFLNNTEDKLDILSSIFTFYKIKFKDEILRSFTEYNVFIGKIILDEKFLEENAENFRDKLILGGENISTSDTDLKLLYDTKDLSILAFIGIQCFKINKLEAFHKILLSVIKIKKILSAEELSLIRSLIKSVKDNKKEFIEFLGIDEIVNNYVIKQEYDKIIEMSYSHKINRSVLFHAFLKIKNYDEAERLLEEEMIEIYEEGIKENDKIKNILKSDKEDKSYDPWNKDISIIFNDSSSTQPSINSSSFFPKAFKPEFYKNKRILDEDIFEFHLSTKKYSAALNTLRSSSPSSFISLLKKVYLSSNDTKFLLEAISLGIERFGSKNYTLMKIFLSFLHLEEITLDQRLTLLLQILEKTNFKGEEDYIYAILHNNTIDLIDRNPKESLILINYITKYKYPKEFYILYLSALKVTQQKDQRVESFYTEFKNTLEKKETNEQKPLTPPNEMPNPTHQPLDIEISLLFFEYFLSTHNNTLASDSFSLLNLELLTNDHIFFLISTEERIVHNIFTIKIEILLEAKKRSLLSTTALENILENTTYYGPIQLFSILEKINIKNYISEKISTIIKEQKKILERVKGKRI